MYKTIAKCFDSRREEWILSVGQNNGKSQGGVELLHMAQEKSSVFNLYLWTARSERPARGYPGYSPAPVDVPLGKEWETQSEINSKIIKTLTEGNRTSRVRHYAELLLTTEDRVDEGNANFYGGWYDYETPDSRPVEWADWTSLVRYPLPIYEAPMEINLLSFLGEKEFLDMKKGEILAFRILHDLSEPDYQFSYGDVVTILGNVIGE